MKVTNPFFPVKVRRILTPVGSYTHAVDACPRCRCIMGITEGMLPKGPGRAVESIICKGRDGECDGHYYLWPDSLLEFVGTVGQ